MHLGRRFFTGAALLCIALPGFASSHAHRGPTAPHLFSRRTSRGSFRPASQRVIDDSRATQIQTALAGAGYLSGEPSGHWDTGTESAMQRFQSDHGWQTKLIPDSRAIIKLGLGPKQNAGGIDENQSGLVRESSPSTALSPGHE